MNTKHGLTNETVAQIRTAFSRFPEVEEAVLYGSRAKGNFKPGSDIDLTLSGNELNARVLGRIDDELDDLLLPYRFHLSILPRITHTGVIDHIRRVGVVFYEKKPAAAVKN